MWRVGGGNWNGNAIMSMMRYFSSSSRQRAPNLRKINPRVPFQEATSIAQGLYEVIKINGPLTISNAWNHAKGAGISGLTSKTHMKIMLKWMRGRSMLKQICNQAGSSKKIFLTSLPQETRQNQPQETRQNQPNSSMELKLNKRKPSKLNKNKVQ